MKYMSSGILTFGLIVGTLTAEDVGDKTKKVADKTVDTTKQAGRTVADKAEDAGDATVEAQRRPAIVPRTRGRLPLTRRRRARVSRLTKRKMSARPL